MEKSIQYLTDRKSKMFSCRQILRERLIPWATSNQTLKRIIDADIQSENILKTEVKVNSLANRYSIKGINLLKYLNKYGSVLMLTKRKYGTKRSNNSKRKFGETPRQSGM